MGNKRKVLIVAAILLALSVGVLGYFVVQRQSEPAVLVGLQKADGESYYYNANGEKQYGWQTIDGQRYYFDPLTGAAVKGWFTDDDGATYYFGPGGYALTGTQTIDGKKYSFDSQGRLISDVDGAGYTWEVVDGQHFCIDKDGNYVTGLALINGSYYYFDENGVRQGGLVTVDGKVYYFSPETGRAAKGWKTIDGETYYFGTDGSALTGTHTINGKQEEFDAQGRLITKASSSSKAQAASSSSKAAVANNPVPVIDPAPAVPDPAQPVVGKWVTVDGKVYFQNPDGSYKKGIVDDETGRYFCDPDTGERRTGLIAYNGAIYYFDPSSGKAISGWLSDPNNPANNYYFGSDGAALKSLQVIAGQKYLFDPQTGVRLSGLVKFDGKVYYFAGEYDSAVTGWHTVQQEPKVVGTAAAAQDQPLLLLTAAGGSAPLRAVSPAMASAASSTYYFCADHFALTGLQRIHGPDGTEGWFGFDENGRQVKGWYKFSGHYYLFNDSTGMAVTNTWVTHPDDFDAKGYLGDNGAMVKGLADIGGKKYCFDSEGKRLRGWIMAGNNYYCFEGEEDAALTSVWKENDKGEKFYFGGDGAAYVGVRDIGADTYYFAGIGVMQTGWQNTPGGVYCLGEDGRAIKNTWADNGGKRYYLGASGAAVTGLQTLTGPSGGSGMFFFASNGVQQSGWQTTGGKKYLFAGEDNRAVTGLFKYGFNQFYFGSDGAALTGLQKLDGKLYFYDLNAYLRKTGWQTIGGAHYYFDRISGAAQTGWFVDGLTRGVYYFSADGKALVGAQTVDGAACQFDQNGRLLPETGGEKGVWEERDGKKYYLLADGTVSIGLQIIGDARYYFGQDGAMQTGWVTESDRRYYFKEDGQAAAGWFPSDEDRQYYLTESGAALMGVEQVDGVLYRFDETGKLTTGQVTENGVTYYFDATTGKAVSGWVPSKEAEGAQYFDPATFAMAQGKTVIGEETFLFSDAGQRQTGLHQDAGGTIYGFFGTNGAAIKGASHIDGDKTYRFDADGAAYIGLNWLDDGSGAELYAFRADASQVFGFESFGGSLYYFDPANGGKALRGKQTLASGDGTHTYIFDSNQASALIGIVVQDGATYVIGADGRVVSEAVVEGFTWKPVEMGDGSTVLYYTDAEGNPYKTGLTELDGFIYLFSAEGAAATGWQPVDGAHYHFGQDGKASIGWLREGEDGYYFTADGKSVRGGDLEINGTTYRFDAEGKLEGTVDAEGSVTEATVPDYNKWVDNTYYDSTGNLAKGATLIGEDYYYFGEDGAMLTGWQPAEGMPRYYLEPNGDSVEASLGKAYRGWQQVDGRWYHFDEANAQQQVKWQVRAVSDTESLTYYYDPDTGAIPDGFAQVGGVTRYFMPEGHMAVGLVSIDESQYYFYNNGAMATGVVTVGEGEDARTYSFDAETGRAATGWNRAADGKRYYFTDGAAVAGWQLIDERWYHFDEQALHQLTGWQERTANGETHRYYYNADGTLPPVGISNVNGMSRYVYPDGHVAVGWATLEDGVHYFDPQGQQATGDTVIDGVFYPFSAEGVLPQGWHATAEARYFYTDKGAVKDWFQDEGVWYAFDEATGKQLLGFQTRDGQQFHYDENGAAALGWTDFGGIVRYFYPDGHLAEGWQTIDAKLHYFLPESGELATGLHIIDGVHYSFDAEGNIQYGWNWSNDGKRYYLGEKGAVTGWNQIDGRWYLMDGTGAQQMGWQTRVAGSTNLYYFYDTKGELPAAGWGTVDGARRYVLADGQMARGLVTLDSVRYYFNEKGVAYTGWQSIGGRWYLFGSDGAQLTGWQQRTVSGGYVATYYYFANGDLPAAGWNSDVEGVRRYVLADGEMARGWLTLGSYRYYFGERGVPFTGLQTIDGVQYGFDQEGRLVSPPVITAVDFETGGAAQKRVTISGYASDLLADRTLQYSFDGGASWGGDNSRLFNAGSTLNAGTLQIRDSLGQVVAYHTAITLDAAKTTLHGVDVSSYQGYIDWAAVKASGQVDFAIIRSLHWSSTKGYYAIDPYFDYNVRAAKAQGIKVGTYLYSYAFKESEMEEEIAYFMNSSEVQGLLRDGIYFDLPVFVDYEDKLILQHTSSYEQRTNIVRYGMQRISQLSGGRFRPGFYVNRDWALNKLNGAQLQAEGYDLWLARWGVAAHGWSPQPALWQYTNGNYGEGTVPGIPGRVDRNYLYVDYSGTINSGASAPQVSVSSASPSDYYVTVTNQNGQQVTGTASDIIAQVVMAEVGGFGNDEVYKAQAVAAQSWIRNRQANGYPAPSVTLKAPTAQVTAAVRQVVGQVLTYNGQTAMTPYFAYGNGMTNNAQYWNASNNIPYLTNVASPYDAQVRSAYTGTISEAQLRERLTATYGYDVTAGIAPQDWIKITGRNAGNYVTGLNVCGRTPKTEYFYLTMLPYASGGRTVYPVGSPDFDVSYANGTFTFTTRGYGHCVGMSQTGAYGFALQGYNYQQILSHYFPGTTIGSV